MRISKKKVNPSLKKQNCDLLYKVIADIKNPQEAKEFLDSFLGVDELEAISRRLGIVWLLDKGKTYADIKTDLGVSSTTVASIAHKMKKGEGFKIALQKIRAEEWADKWTNKLTKMMKIRRK